MEVRERHLRGGDQEQVPLARNLEQVGLELRQVARALQRRPIDHERRLHLQVPVLPRVQIEHELDQRARQPRARAQQHREPRARHAGRPLEIENPQRGPDVPVRLRHEVERRRIAVPADLQVVRGAPADGHAGVRKVGQRHEQAGSLLLDAVQLDRQLPDLLRSLPVRLEDRGGVPALPLGPRHLVAGRVLLALEPLELRDQPPPPVLERGQRLELAVGVEAAIAQAAAHLILMVAHEDGIQHGEILYPNGPVVG